MRVWKRRVVSSGRKQNERMDHSVLEIGSRLYRFLHHGHVGRQELVELLKHVPSLRKKPATTPEHTRVRQLAFWYYGLLYPERLPVSEDSEKKERQKAYVAYNRARHRLSVLAGSSAEPEIPPTHHKSPFHAARYRVEVYNERKESTEMGEAVAHPTAMAVEVSDETSLQGVLNELQADRAVSSDVEVFTKGALFADGRVDMCKQVVGPDHIRKHMDAVARSSRVKHFLLGNNIVGGEGARAIGEFISRWDKKCSIETWYLAGNDIDGPGMWSLALPLARDTAARSLWLKRNPLGLDGARAVSHLLTHNRSLQTLDLQNTGLMDEGCAVLFEGLRHHPSLTSLYLDANGLSAASGESIAGYFLATAGGGHHQLARLSVGLNRLGDEGTRKIAASLGDAHLVSLNLNANRIETEGLGAILDWARRSTSLRCLDLGYYKSAADMQELPNNFSDPAASRALSEFIRHDTPLQQLHVNTTLMTASGIAELASSLQNNTHLLQLGCFQHHLVLEKRLVVQIAKQLRKNRDAFMLQHFRTQKHGEEIYRIDSMYRNKM